MSWFPHEGRAEFDFGKRNLADFGRDSLTPILGELCPWDGSYVLGGERIFLVFYKGAIVAGEVPSRAEVWNSEPYEWPKGRPRAWRERI